MLKQLVIIFTLVSFFGAFAQDKTGTGKNECSKGCCSDHKSNSSMQMTYMDKDSTHGMHHEMKSVSKMHGKHNEMKSDSTKESSIIREGQIDLQAIDQNKDGKVYQDQMCWNVISDEPGECPQCGMALKEVSLEKAKENLLKNEYKVKEKQK